MPQEHDDPDAARIDAHQMSMFARDAADVCREIGLSSDQALLLYRERLLSFDPIVAGPLDDAREAELVFLGTLLVRGCPLPLVHSLIEQLRPPYCYDLGRVFFDWRANRWRLRPGMEDPESAFLALLERLDACNERIVLLAVREWLDDALDLARDRRSVLAHEGGAAAGEWTMRLGRSGVLPMRS